MKRDPLDTLLRLRRMDVREHMRELAISLQAEAQAEQVHRACQEAIARETTEVRGLAAPCPVMLSFIGWRTRAVQALQDAAIRAMQTRDATQAARTRLGDARGAMRAVELAIDRRKAAADLTAQRVTQHTLDDTTRRSPD